MIDLTHVVSLGLAVLGMVAIFALFVYGALKSRDR